MSTTYELTAGQLVTRAYRVIGDLVPPWVPDDDQMTQGLIALNLMLKGWQADGINLFRQTQIAIPVSAGQGWPGNPITITPLIMGLEEARLVIQPSPNLYERELGIIPYVQYMMLPNKQSASSPSTITFDKQVNASNVYIFPLSQLGCTINATVARTVNDVLTPQDIPDFPSEWTEGAMYNLADRIMDDSGVRASDPQTSDSITKHAIAFYTKLLAFDRPDSVFIRPWGSRGTGKAWR